MKISEVQSFLTSHPEYPLVDKLFVLLAHKDFPSLEAIENFLHTLNEGWNDWLGCRGARYAEYQLLQDASQGKVIDLTEKEKSNKPLCAAVAALYRNSLKNREFGKESPQNFCSERATIALGQGASENENYEANPTTPKTDCSSCFGMRPKKGEKEPEQAIEKKLRRACYYGDIQEAKRIFKSGYHEYPALRLHRILRSDLSNKTGWTKLYLQHISINDLFMQDKAGYNPLHVALFEKNEEAAQILLEALPDKFINQKTDDGRTAIYFALRNDFLKLAKKLIERGARLSRFEIFQLADLESEQLSEFIPHLAPADLRDLLEEAILDESSSKVDLLVPTILEEEFEEASKPNGKSLLHLAVESKNVEIVRKILEKTRNRNQKSANEETPLQYAQRLLGSDSKITKLLQGVL